jgi:group I intron endonuclease
MGHQPTIFYILENESLGTWWVGKITTIADCPFRSITQDELNNKLGDKYEYLNPYLTLVTLNKNWNACYGVERWLSKLEYKINKEPEKYAELKQLLMAGWDDCTETSTLSVFHVLKKNQPINEIYQNLIKSRKGLNRCLNTAKFVTYEDKKKDPNFLKAIGRKKVLMDMKKKQKLPKPETLAKHDIKDEEIKEVMEPQGIIYKIDCEVSGKSYIGKTIQSLKMRIQQHRGINKNSCRALSQAIQEHGWDNFKVSTIWEGNASKLGEMERKLISEHQTMEPDGYNIREGGGRSERVSDTSRKLMIEKQREISKRRGGLLGKLIPNGHGKITSWSVNVSKNNRRHTIGPFKTKEEATEIQKKFTENPDEFELPEPKRLGNGKGNGIYYRKDRNKWQVLPRIDGKNVSLGTYKTEEEANEVLERYRKDPEKFIKPCDRDDKGVTFKKNENVWQASFYDGKKNQFLGRYQTKEEAINMRKKYIEDPGNFTRPNQRN